MDTDTLKKLTAVIQDRMRMQHEQDAADSPDAPKYTEAEHIAFALEEAWLNDELEFINPNTEYLRQKLYACSPHDLAGDADNAYRNAIDAGLKA